MSAIAILWGTSALPLLNKRILIAATSVFGVYIFANALRIIRHESNHLTDALSELNNLRVILGLEREWLTSDGDTVKISARAFAPRPNRSMLRLLLDGLRPVPLLRRPFPLLRASRETSLSVRDSFQHVFLVVMLSYAALGALAFATAKSP